MVKKNEAWVQDFISRICTNNCIEKKKKKLKTRSTSLPLNTHIQCDTD